MLLLLKRLNDRALRPTRSFPDDAGLDLYITDDLALAPGEFRDIDTGWAIKIADGYWGSVKARSSTFFKRKLVVHEGTIDAGYTGRLSIGVHNPGENFVELRTGDRIAQLVLIPLIIHSIEIVTELPKTMRGPEGFGSTGPGR
jgi:dUTP pyrophosphatase